MSDFTQGVVNVWGGECLGVERLTIDLNSEEVKNPDFLYHYLATTAGFHCTVFDVLFRKTSRVTTVKIFPF